MDLKNFDIRHMPVWTYGIIYELEELCWRELKQECGPYNRIMEKRDTLLERYSFLATVDDGSRLNGTDQAESCRDRGPLRVPYAGWTQAGHGEISDVSVRVQAHG